MKYIQFVTALLLFFFATGCDQQQEKFTNSKVSKNVNNSISDAENTSNIQEKMTNSKVSKKVNN